MVEMIGRVLVMVKVPSAEKVDPAKAGSTACTLQ
jgi:hypothetical protein